MIPESSYDPGICDNCGSEQLAKPLKTSGDIIWMCEPCWYNEMQFRLERKKNLDDPMDIMEFPSVP